MRRNHPTWRPIAAGALRLELRLRRRRPAGASLAAALVDEQRHVEDQPLFLQLPSDSKGSKRKVKE